MMTITLFLDGKQIEGHDMDKRHKGLFDRARYDMRFIVMKSWYMVYMRWRNNAMVVKLQRKRVRTEWKAACWSALVKAVNMTKH